MAKTRPDFDPFPKHDLPEITNENDVQWDEMQSPSAKFRIFERELSGTMLPEASRSRDSENPPFEVAMVGVPPGATNWPRHVHLTQWEYYIILAGSGQVIRDDETRTVKVGDHILQPPGVAHHIVNIGDEDLLYYVIANNPAVDVCYYPDSDKWGISGGRGYFRMGERKRYWDGEDPAAEPKKAGADEG